jgi:hypothetical protein
MSRIAKASASAAARRTRISANSFSLLAAKSLAAFSDFAFFSAACSNAAGAPSVGSISFSTADDAASF